MSDITMTCEEFDAQLEGYLEGELDHLAQQRADQHRAECGACAAMVADLDGLVLAAQSLPLPAPSRDLWPDIEARLETPVRVLPTSTRGAISPTLPWRALAAAAVVLVTVSAGVTWNVARRAPVAGSTTLASTDSMPARSSVASDSPVMPPRVIDVEGVNAGSNVGSNVGTSAGSNAADNVVGSAGTMPPSTLGGSIARDARTSGYVASAPTTTPARVVAASTGGPRAVALDTLYGREIAMLRTVAETQLGLLDSTTVSVVRKNLDISDNAIRESRTALAADPNSGFLLEQLDRAYERKVDLLRRLALL